LVSGLIRGTRWGTVARITTASSRPPARLIFNLNNHAKNSRVDVQNNGYIRWVAGGRDHSWLSLSGIGFSRSPAITLPKLRGWSDYGGQWARGEIRKDGDLITVSGLLRGGRYNNIARLPVGYRPRKRFIFSVNNHAKAARVDVNTNGIISWHAGGKDHGWLSLSGITFEAYN